MNSSDDKYKKNGSNYDQDSETIIRTNLNERSAEEMKKAELVAKQ
ncbi:MAG: hypothetical protein ACJ71C_10860 [Nitrososphaeraceae archaeon]